MRCLIDVASLLEFERQRQLSYSEHVVAYHAQRGNASALIKGSWRTSVCDFEVHSAGRGIRYEEIKYVSELRDPKSRAHMQIRVQRLWCQEMGYEHAVVTDEFIWRNPILNNSLAVLMPEFTVQFPRLLVKAAPLRELIVEYVLRHPGAAISQVLDARPRSVPLHLYRFALFEMIRRHQLDAAIEQIALSHRSKVHLTGNYEEAW